MSNSDVVSGWVKAMDNGCGYSPTALHSSSMHADGVYLISYATPIAKYVDGKYQLTSRKFCQTTSKQQNLVKRFVPADKLEIVDEIECPSNAYPWKWTGK